MSQPHGFAGRHLLDRFPWEAVNGYRRRLLLVWVVAAALVAIDVVICLFGFQKEWPALYSHLLENEVHHAELLEKSGYSIQFQEQVLSLLVLRDALTSRGVLEKSKANSLLARDFSIRINQDHRVANLILLDRRGQEVVRVNAEGGRAHIVPPDQLVSHHHDRVFAAAKVMRAGQVYIGPLEKAPDGHGFIQFALPVLDDNGPFQGVLISEYMANQLFQPFQNAARHVDGTGMLLDRHGRWLIGSPDSEGAVVAGSDTPLSTFADRYPVTWKKMVESESGQIEQADGVVTYVWKNPLDVVSRTMHVVPDPDLYRWVVTEFLPVSYLNQRRHALTSAYLAVGVGTLFLILFAATMMSIHFFRQKSKLRHEASTAFLNHLLSSTSVVYHVCARHKGKFVPVYFGPGFCELTGYDEGALLEAAESGEECVFESIHVEDVEGIHRLLYGEHCDDNAHFEFRFRHADGHWIWISSSSKLIFDANGEVVEMISSWQDISERKRIEEELQASESRFRAYAEYSPVGIFQNDLQGKCIYVNRRCGEITGLSESESLGQGWERGLHPEDAERVVAGWKTWWDNPEHFYHGEYRFVHPDGKVVWVSAIGGALRDAQGELTGFIGALVDITETKKLLAEVQHLSQQLIRQREEENRELAWALHDDIGQGLVSVHFYSELIRRQCELGHCHESNRLSGELSNLVNGLMQVVHAQLGQIRPGNLEELGLVSSLQELAAQWQVSKTPEVSLALEEIEGLSWEAELALYRVAQGALVNVMRHAAAKQVKIRLAEVAGMIVLEVEDNGRGFSADTVKGYGLLGMREHMTAVGGKLIIESSPGKGTRIVAEAPLRKVSDSRS